MRKLHKSKGKVKMERNYKKESFTAVVRNSARSAAMPNPVRSIVDNSPHQPMPALSHMLQRLEDANSRMAEKVSFITQVNDRLLGGVPADPNTKIDTGGGLVSQIEQQIIQYEQFISMLGGQLERLSSV